MRKYSVILVIIGSVISGLGIKCFADDISWQNIGREITDLKTVLVSFNSPNIIYAGASSGVFKTEDGGGGWRNIFSVRGRNRSVNFLSFGFYDKNCLYAATNNGLFYSSNAGKSWKRTFKGRNYLENECTTVVISPVTIYLGTKGGLFISKDKGHSWHKEKGKLGSSHILAIAYNKIEADHSERGNFFKDSLGYQDNASQNSVSRDVYVACIDGVFRSIDGGQSWERIFVAYPVEDRFETDEDSDDKDEEEGSSGIRYVSCDPVNLSCLYVATSRGIHKSCDKGQSWEPVSEYGLLNRDAKFLLFSAKADLYAITKSGVFEYMAGRWQELTFGLVAGEVRFLTSDNQNNLYAACEKGLFRTDAAHFKHGSRGNAVSLYYKDEPKISEVQQAAIKYAEVGQEKIKQWRKQAARKAILPQVGVGLDRNIGDLWHWETGSTTKTDDDILRKGRDGLEWNVSLSWDLGELIWNNDQTSIDVRSRLMVQLRDDILDEVTKLYFERIRVKMELDNLSIEDRKKRFEKELKLQELTASIDSLTGGYFSSHL